MRWAAGKQLVLVLVVALAVRLTAVAWWQSHHPAGFVLGDSDSYFTLAWELAHGQPYQYGPAQVFRAPGYPLLLAPVFWLVQPERAILAARIETALFGALAVAGVWWLARQLFGPRAGVAAAAFAAFYPESVAQSVLVLSDTPFCALMLLQLGLWVAAYKPEDPFPDFGTWPGKAAALAFAAGLAAGAATLVRPSWILFTPLAAMVVALLDHERLKRIGMGLAMLAGMAMVLAPWWLRNAYVTAHFVPTTLQVGASLYDGLSPHATGASDMKPAEAIQQRFWQDHPVLLPHEAAGQLEYLLDQRMRAEAWDWAAKHPREAVRLAGVKFLRTWNVWPNEASFSAWPVRLAVALSYIPLLILGVVGGVRTLTRGGPCWLCWFPAVYFSALQAVFVGSIRYRQPAMLALIVLAAGVVGGMTR